MEIINKDKFLKIQEFAKKFLLLGIILFALMVSFNPNVGKKIINNLFYIWILTLNFRYIIDYLKNNRIFSILIIFSIWILFTCYVNSSSSYYLFDVYIKHLLLPVIIIVTTIKIEHLKYIISAFLMGMFINEMISYGMYFDIFQSKFLGFDLVGNKNNPVPFLSSHMEYTLFLSLAIVISIFSFFNIQNKYLKVVLAFFIITMTTNMFLTTGKTGQFTLLLSLCLLIIIYFRHSYKYIISSFVLLIMTFIIAFSFSDNTNQRIKEGYKEIEQVLKNNDHESSFGVRLSSYSLIPEIIKHDKFNVFYGIGYCELNDTIHEIHMKEFGEESIFKIQEGHLHNSYITIFAGTGFVGLILFLLLWYFLFRTKINDRYLNFIRYTSLFVLFFGGFTENMFRQREVLMLASIFISIIILSSYLKGKKIE